MSPRMQLTVVLFIFLAFCALCGLTFVRALNSQLAVEDMNMELTDVRQIEPKQFSVDIVLVNRGAVETQIISVGLFLRHNGREIAYEKWEPHDLMVEPYDEVKSTIELRSPLSAGDLPDVEKTPDIEWSVRAELEVAHPMREEILLLYRQPRLQP